MRRIRCAEFGERKETFLDGRTLNEPVFLCGRVLHCHDSTVTISDSTGTASLAPVQGAVSVGDIIRVDWSGEKGNACVLSTYRRSVPFPSPGSEYFRLNKDSARRIDLIHARALIKRAARSFFDERGYLEVDTPRRVRSPGLEPHLRAFPTGRNYLITSPEYHLKRLLAGGLEKIYSLGPCWRDEECGSQHLDEFYMLEWYRAYATLSELMAETEVFLKEVLARVAKLLPAVIESQQGWAGCPFERISMTGMFLEASNVCISNVVTAHDFRSSCKAAGIHIPDHLSFESAFSRVWVDYVEPKVQKKPAVFVHSFPAPLAALSSIDPGDPTVAQRFELYVNGVELANAFQELTNPDEQYRRFVDEQDQRRKLGQEAYSVDQRFLEALREGIPPSTGIALGLDRLVMVLCGENEISATVPFSADER